MGRKMRKEKETGVAERIKIILLPNLSLCVSDF